LEGKKEKRMKKAYGNPETVLKEKIFRLLRF
jgi:hypothetical protein